MIIFCVSPNYLQPVLDESLEYSFMLQGYGSFSEAVKGLAKTNPSEIYGFSVVMDKLPNDLKEVREFIHKCNMISYGSEVVKRFVFSLNDDAGLNGLLKQDTSNLEIYLSRFEILTDSKIRREVFGTILSAYLEPFSLSSKNTKSIPSSGRSKLLRYTPLFPDLFLHCIEEVRENLTYSETLYEDKHLEVLKSKSDILYDLRLYGIQNLYNVDITVDLGEVLNKINNISDSKMRFQYKLMYEYIVDKGLSFVLREGVLENVESIRNIFR